jgi:hypothetical protein
LNCDVASKYEERNSDKLVGFSFCRALFVIILPFCLQPRYQDRSGCKFHNAIETEPNQSNTACANSRPNHPRLEQIPDIPEPHPYECLPF